MFLVSLTELIGFKQNFNAASLKKHSVREIYCVMKKYMVKVMSGL